MKILKWTAMVIISQPGKSTRRMPIIVYARNKVEAEMQIDSNNNYSRIGPAVKLEEE